jgi:hypothetical protein
MNNAVSDEKFTPVETHGNMIANSYHIAFSIKITQEIGSFWKNLRYLFSLLNYFA